MGLHADMKPLGQSAPPLSPSAAVSPHPPQRSEQAEHAAAHASTCRPPPQPPRHCSYPGEVPCPTQGKKKPTGTGPEIAVTGQTGLDRFRFGSVSNRPKFKIQI